MLCAATRSPRGLRPGSASGMGPPDLVYIQKVFEKSGAASALGGLLGKGGITSGGGVPHAAAPPPATSAAG